jgi:TM2 domain-containing membrane protein YozV
LTHTLRDWGGKRRALLSAIYERRHLMSDQKEKGPDEVFCRSCGAVIKKEAEICVKCGVRQKGGSGSESNSNWLTTLLVTLFLGGLGVHRFINGKIGTGILMLVTGGGCGIWWLIDLIMVLTEKFTDSNGNPIKKN